MRYFIGIDIPEKTKLAIQQWREKYWVQHFELAPVPMQNFHITLAFLGHIDELQHEQLCTNLNEITTAPFKILIDQFSVWKKPPIGLLGCNEVTADLKELQQGTSRVARQANISIGEREYIPHITLARKCKSLVSVPLMEPCFEFKVEEFCLFESVSTSSGVRYPVRQKWQLNR